MAESAMYGNSALEGGGIYNEAVADVSNSTISNNFANGSGGGLFNNTLGPCGFCVTNLDQVTMVGNLANQAVTGGTGGGIYNLITSTVWLQNTLLDRNVRITSGPTVFDDCAGLVLSADYNLISTQAGCSFASSSHDLKDVPGLTGPLQNNGGPNFINPPTLTNALLPGSPAIDYIPKGASGCGTSFANDQREFRRPAFGRHSFACDTLAPLAGQVRVGAFELQQTVDLPLVRK